MVIFLVRENDNILSINIFSRKQDEKIRVRILYDGSAYMSKFGWLLMRPKQTKIIIYFNTRFSPHVDPHQVYNKDIKFNIRLNCIIIFNCLF